MPPKRRHGNVSESSSGDIKRIRIVSKENQNEETTFMCEICSKILKSSETLKSHKKAMHENDKFICTDCGESFDMWNRKNLYSIDKKKWKIKRYW